MSEGGIKVSVALCTYNGERFVAEQVESILRQTQPPDELIVSDDGSSDRTLEIVRDLTAGCRFPVVIRRNTQNLGDIKNFEKAVEAASGDVIFLSDCDDVWFREKIAAMTPCFGGDANVVLAYCNAQITDESLKPSGATLFERRRDMQLGAALTADQIGRGLGFNAPMMAFRSTLKPFVLPFSNQWCHDHWISFIAYAMGEVRSVDQPLLYYRRHGKNVGGDPDLDGGLAHRWRVAAKKSELKNYSHRVRRFDHIVKRLQEIKTSGKALTPVNRLDELLRESQDCLQFARVRESMKQRPRPLRVPAGLVSLVRGEYRRHAHGAKSFLQDVALP